ncbi:6-phosphogluconolactonase [Puteibacter caeruleilacunae]|nr:6-phosphogluconolactonase [Puteibacter caeruleilacunae]
MRIKIAPTPLELSFLLARKIVTGVNECSNEGYHIALSGGSTPKLLFEILAKEHIEDVDWTKVHFWWGDERCVEPNDDESNFKWVDELLFNHINIPDENIHRILGETNPLAEAQRYADEINQCLLSINGNPQFDLIILGMGDDGHTASIFPYQLELMNSNDSCVVAQHPVSGQQRISMTGKVLNHAKETVFLVSGENKADKVNEIINKEGDYQTYPAAHIQPENERLYWFLDEAAAQGLR